MNPTDFRASLAAAAPPPGIPLALAGLWWDANGNWEKAHHCAQEQDDADGAALHAYLHRKEGDLTNAGHWYRRASRPMPNTPLAAEWDDLLNLLAK